MSLSAHIFITQVVCCEGVVREKPEHEAQARSFLASYQRGSAARCVNGLVVLNTGSGRRATAVCCATVHWQPFPNTVVDTLIHDGHIFRSAGGFLVEDSLMRPYVDRIEVSDV